MTNNWTDALKTDINLLNGSHTPGNMSLGLQCTMTPAKTMSVSPDQYHMTILWVQVYEVRGCVFY